jgi:hypothetical protein
MLRKKVQSTEIFVEFEICGTKGTEYRNIKTLRYFGTLYLWVGQSDIYYKYYGTLYLWVTSVIKYFLIKFHQFRKTHFKRSSYILNVY